MKKFRVGNGSGLYVTDVYANGHILVSARFSEARIFEGDYWKEFWDKFEYYQCDSVHTIEVGDIVEVVGKCRIQVVEIEQGSFIGMLLEKDQNDRFPLTTVDLV